MKKQDKKPMITVSKGGKPEPPVKSNISNPVKLKDAHAVGKRIKYYRERQGLEQKDVAREVGITANTVSNWETAEPVLISVLSPSSAISFRLRFMSFMVLIIL